MRRRRSGWTRPCSCARGRAAAAVVDVDRRRRRRSAARCRPGPRQRRSRAGGWPPAAEAWRANIAWATLDLSGPYRSVFDTMLPDAVQVADPFHVVKLANTKLDECRRRVQNETLGHRGRKDDPLYRCRRLLTKADERLDDHGRSRAARSARRRRSPTARSAWPGTPRKSCASLYDHTDPDLAVEFVDRLGHDLQDESCPVEVRSLGRTLLRWRDQIAAWHQAHVSQRADRSGQQPHQARQAGRVRVHPLAQLPDPRPALRRPTQLGPTRHHHTPLKSEEPLNLARCRRSRRVS